MPESNVEEVVPLGEIAIAVGTGIVWVGGEKVQGAYGQRQVIARHSCIVTCQRCYEINVEWPLVLWRRWETALGRRMYWFGPPPGPLPHYCTACLKLQTALDLAGVT